MLNVAGMRMRMSFAFLMVAVAASVTVIGLIAVGGCPAPNVWLEPEAMVWAAAGDGAARTPRETRRRAPGSRSWIFMVPSARARGVPKQLQRMRCNCVASQSIAAPVAGRAVTGWERGWERGR